MTKATPPTFMAVADNDKRCAEICVRFYQSLVKAGVPAELHIYARGGHGFGMHERPMPVTGWTARLKEWLDDSGFTTPAKAAARVAAAAVRRPASARPVAKDVSPPAARIKAPKDFRSIWSTPFLRRRRVHG